MKTVLHFMRLLVLLAAVVLAIPVAGFASEKEKAPLKKDELAQLVAPVALYPDALLSQIFMASTYPLEIVEADRWTNKNKALKGDALAKELEKQSWDPSVKSLVNFPPVLASMSEKLELTSKIGDAFLAQPKEMMDVVQELRKQAQAAGNLKTTKEMKIVEEGGVIVIQAADPQVVYVPTYSPVLVYGPWMYPYYPPYYYYPPPPYPAPHYGVAIAVGVAWGYAWGSCNWHGGSVNVNIHQNTNINANINRNNYKGSSNNGSFQHDPSHRKGVSYRDSSTAQKYNRASTNDAAKSRDAYRGRSDMSSDLNKSLPGGASNRSGSRDSAAHPTSSRSDAFSGMDKGGSARDFSSRGSSSRQGMPSGGGGAKGGGARKR